MLWFPNQPKCLYNLDLNKNWPPNVIAWMKTNFCAEAINKTYKMIEHTDLKQKTVLIDFIKFLNNSINKNTNKVSIKKFYKNDYL